jgi:hypothetical protein
MKWHMTKHKFQISADEMAIANSITTQEAPPTKELKQQSLSRTVKKFAFHQLMGPELKEDHKWKVVEFLLAACPPFLQHRGEEDLQRLPLGF